MKKLALGIVVILAALVAMFLLPNERGEGKLSIDDGSGGRPPELGELRSDTDQASSQREQLQEQDLALPDSGLEGPHLQGRVIFPAGSPRDESLRVNAYASDRDFHWKHYYPNAEDSKEEIASYLNRRGAQPVRSVPIRSNGDFSLALSGLGPQVWLALDGRFLYMENPIRLNVEQARAGEIQLVLRASLGGAITGRMQRADGESLQQATVGLALDFSRGMESGSVLSFSSETLAQRCASDGRFELRALRPARWQVVGRDASSALSLQDDVLVQRGQISQVELALNSGATIRGSVRAQASPLTGVSVAANLPGFGALLYGPWGFLRAHTRSLNDGSFEIQHVSRKAVSVSAFLQGRSSEVKIETPLEAGDVLEDVELVFADLGWISGLVEDSKGRPVSGVEVSNAYLVRNSWRTFGRASLSDSNGRFRVPCSHPDAPQRLDAARRDASGRVIARAEDLVVAFGDSDVMLELGPTRSIIGSVHAVSGEPLGGVLVALSWSHRLPWHAATKTDAKGAFTLAGVAPDTWDVSASLNGYETASAGHKVTLNGPDAALDFVLTPKASPEPVGVVVLPDGTPAAGALVLNDSDSQYVFDDPESAQVCDASGRFLRRAGKHVSAWTPGYAPSLPAAFTETGEELVLRLRLGGTLQAQVFTKQGELGHDYFLYLGHMEHGYSRVGVTLQDGSCLLTDLAPGRWIGEARPMTGMGFHAAEPEDNREHYKWSQSEKLSASFSVVAGETIEVVFGPVRSEQVLLSGVLSLGGVPIQGSLTFVEDGMYDKSGSLAVESDSAGNYRIQLPHPGTYTVLGVCKSANVGSIQLVSVPDLRVANLSVDLPAASIRVQVFGQGGKPMGKVKLGLMQAGGTGTALNSMLQTVYKARTDARGEALFSGLKAGVYRVSGIDSLFEPIDVEVEDALVEVVIAHEPLGTLAIRLRSQANPLPESIDVFVRAESGAWVGHHKVRNFPKDGYRIELVPGTYSVFACGFALATRSTQATVVTQDQTSSIELELAPGSFVALEFEGAQDPNAIRLHLSDVDGLAWEGIVVTEMARNGGTMSLFTHEGLRPNFAYFGALPPGEYRLEAQCLEQSAHATFNLDGSEARFEMKMTFR